MAPDTSETLPQADDEDVSVAELVFSCCLCQATVTDVYATVDSNHGFHSGSSGEDGIVTKMYISQCSHVFCSKHLENGAVPFHPEGQQPRAKCPRCSKEKSDDEPKDMFAIQGLNPGQYDPTIPERWMNCPAIKLDDKIEGMDAVRFQYMALSHYGREARKQWKAAQRKQAASEAALSKERKTRKRLQSEQVELKKQLEVLQNAEAQLKKWEDRKPIINRCMNAFTEITKDYEQLRGQLIELGYDVPVRKYLLEESEGSGLGQRQPEGQPTKEADSAYIAKTTQKKNASDEENSSSARKRKRDESVNNVADRDHRQISRDLMPPPLPRNRVVQRALPLETLSRPPTISRPPVPPPPRFHEYGQLHQASQDEKSAENQDVFGRVVHNQTQPESTTLRDSTPRLNDQPNTFDLPASQYRQPVPPGYTREPRQEFVYHDPVSLAQLSLQSSGIEGQRVDYSIQGQPFVQRSYDPLWSSPTRSQQVHRPQSAALQHPSEYRSSFLTAPTRQYHESNQSMMPSQMQGYATHHASREDIQPSRYADSPFFKQHSPGIRPPTMNRPPARGDDARQQFRSFVDNHRLPNTSIPDSQRFDQPPIMRPGYGALEYQSQYQSPQRHQQPSTNFRQATEIPQTPRNSQGLFRRPDRPLPPPVFRSPRKPEVRHHTGRITLPPSSRSTVPFAMDQDASLSQIRGVRGMSSHRNVSGYRYSNPNYGATRPLYSSGPRQSIRR